MLNCSSEMLRILDVYFSWLTGGNLTNGKNDQILDAYLTSWIQTFDLVTALYHCWSPKYPTSIKVGDWPPNWWDRRLPKDIAVKYINILCDFLEELNRKHTGLFLQEKWSLGLLLSNWMDFNHWKGYTAQRQGNTVGLELLVWLPEPQRTVLKQCNLSDTVE